MTVDDTKQREAEFFDDVYREDGRAAVRKYYSVATTVQARYRGLIGENCAGLETLEYGCGPGRYGLELARQGAEVTGIDVSETGIELANQRARELGLDNARFLTMDAEALELETNSFDLVFGTGILHHLDLDRALGEIGRVLRPEGRAIFIEPLGHNPAINLYRRLRPDLRTPDERPLRARDLREMARYFDHLEREYYCLTSLLAVPLRRRGSFRAVKTALEAFDRALFRLPLTGLLAWQILLVLTRPRPT